MPFVMVNSRMQSRWHELDFNFTKSRRKNVGESSDKKVQNFLADVDFKSPEQLTIIQEVRNAFLVADKNLAEDIKYGGLVFLQDDTLIGGIFCYKMHVSIEFSNGASFDDPDKLLDGKGRYRRHLKLVSPDDFSAKDGAYYINQAVSNG